MKRRKDGRLRKAITDPRTGKRVYFYGATEREINKKILEYQAQAERGRLFSEVAEEWWGEVYDSFAAQTLRGYKPAYARALIEFGYKYISDITPSDISNLFKKMVIQGFARKTISNQRIIYNQIFNYAIVAGDIQYNPCASVKIPSNAKKASSVKPATDEEERTIIEREGDWILPVFALLSGLRKQELLALQWRDIDFEENVIFVTKAVEHIGQTPRIKDTKTEAGVREVPLLDLLKERLLPLRGDPDAYIFSQNGGKTPLTENQYERAYKKYTKATGVKSTSRRIRHSYATVAVEEDISPKDLQNALGHSDISVTMNVYAAARRKSVNKVATKLNLRYKKPENS